MMLDPIYWLLVGLALLMSLGASAMVKLRFNRGRAVSLASGMTGAEVAAALVKDAGLQGVTIVEHQGFLSDHYNPMTRTLALSPHVYHGTDASAAGVAAHEAGHALQHAQNYLPMWFRSLIVPVANIGSMLGPMVIIGAIMLGAADAASQGGLGRTLAIVGVAMFGAATVFSLITVPVEFDASSRAKERLIALRIVRPGVEADTVRGVLTAAGLTYVAAAISSVLMLLYWAWRAGLIGGQRRD